MQPKVQFAPTTQGVAQSRQWVRLLLLLPGIVLVVVAASLVLRPEPVGTAVRAAEALWQAGQFLEARAQLLAIPPAEAPPRVWVRLAQLHLLRGECVPAQRYVARALAGSSSQLRRDEAALVHLVAGQCAALAGDRRYATAEWSAVDPRSPYRAVSDLLRGDDALHAAETTGALTSYTAALAGPLAEPLPAFAHLRMALVLAGKQPDVAREHLAAIGETLPPLTADLRPFVALSTKDVVKHSRQLEAILAADPAAHAQLLGQQLLDLGLPRLAIVHFEQVPDTAPEAVLARAYAAMARWQLGQKDAAAEQLRELAVYLPQDPAVATLYASIARERGELDAADKALAAAEAVHPLDPAIMVVRSDILVDRHAYAEAIAERRRALALARPEVRARYALALAQLHLDLTYQLCDAGIAAARQATTLAPADGMAWQLLAAVLYHCGDYHGTAEAARSGLAVMPDHTALLFYLGAGQWASGERQSGAANLRAAANLAPASEWRRRAEALLSQAR
ncbi:MAG: hypothetical protein M3R24_18340 [Chloroflexota bacterium]|nr:hypothetical protein [Chloroflexota bacterium]PLS78653.1 MAG: hypothetical protein CYG59_17490 [Chloroflexota bacterium]